MISYERGFVFAAVPKTGTRAILNALKAPIVAQEHMTLRQAQAYMRTEDFANFFKFAIVRNPFDRFISYCAYREPEFAEQPRAVMRRLIADPPFHDVLARPQCLFVLGAKGEVLADEIGRFEDLQGSFDRISERIGVSPVALTKLNASSRHDCRDYYNPELIADVARLYARDFDLFGYDNRRPPCP